MPDPTTLFGPTNRTVTRSGERRTVRLQRPYAATPTELWSACTEPERVARWIGEVTGDRAVGGEVFLRMTADETVVLRMGDEQAAAGKGLGWEDFLNRLHELLAGRDPAAVSWDEARRHLEPVWSALAYTAS